MGRHPEREPPRADDNLRPEIAASWWRSRLLGVEPELAVEAFAAGDFVDTDERLRQSVQPVLDDLVGKLAGTSTAVLLADHRAVIIDRRATTAPMMDTLDRFALRPGFVFAEHAVGTNGIGTAAEERRLVRVAGAEHYAQVLQDFSCYGVPLVHPLTRRLVGVLNLAFAPQDEHPLMESFMADAGGRVEGVLTEWASYRQRAQFELFLALGKRRSKPVLSVMDDAVLLNRSARRLNPAHQAELLRAAEEVAGEGGESAQVSLTLSGQDDPVSVRLHTHSDSTRFTGVVLEVTPASRRRSRPAGDPSSLPGLVGQSPAWRALCTTARDVARARVPVVFTGSPGVGKLAVARAVHQLTGGRDVFVLDAATLPTDGERAWLQLLRCHLDDPACRLVIRHLELCSPIVAAAVAAELDRAGSARAFATCTTTRVQSEELERLLDRFDVRVEIPPLSDRRDDIPVLVDVLIERHAGGRSIRAHPSTIDVLMRSGFPDNARGLESLARRLAARGRSGDVLPEDLPPLEPASAPVHLTALEQAERAVILAALQRAHGNKAAAAADLGISRPTLYRKLTAYKIDVS